jgi:hypothetical protein
MRVRRRVVQIGGGAGAALGPCTLWIVEAGEEDGMVHAQQLKMNRLCVASTSRAASPSIALVSCHVILEEVWGGALDASIGSPAACLPFPCLNSPRPTSVVRAQERGSVILCSDSSAYHHPDIMHI